MKNTIKRIFAPLTVLSAALALAACSNPFGGAETAQTAPGESAAPVQNSPAAVTEAQADFDAHKSPSHFRMTLPTDEAVQDYGQLDFSEYVDATGENGQPVRTSPDGKFTLSEITDDSGSVTRYKYADTYNGVNYYYNADDGMLFAVSTEDYTGNVFYYVDGELNITAVEATTFRDETMDVLTVYNAEGGRVATYVTYTDDDGNVTGYDYFDGTLTRIDSDEYYRLAATVIH